jgi:predicted GNAT family N-acyltransferase
MTAGVALQLETRVATTAAELDAVMQVRTRVFRDEQHMVDDQVHDELERVSTHVYANLPEGVVAVGRLTPPRLGRRDAQIAWVATLPGYRLLGAGSSVMSKLLETADHAGYAVVTLSAQGHAVPFYERFGFCARGATFTVRGIEHRMMERRRPT